MGATCVLAISLSMCNGCGALENWHSWLPGDVVQVSLAEDGIQDRVGKVCELCNLRGIQIQWQDGRDTWFSMDVFIQDSFNIAQVDSALFKLFDDMPTEALLGWSGVSGRRGKRCMPYSNTDFKNAKQKLES